MYYCVYIFVNIFLCIYFCKYILVNILVYIFFAIYSCKELKICEINFFKNETPFLISVKLKTIETMKTAERFFTFADFMDGINQHLEYISKKTSETCYDEIWHIRMGNTLNLDQIKNNGYIAGSCALNCFIKLLGFKPKWEPSDVDIFIPNSTKGGRIQDEESNLDFVKSECKNINDVLLNFDIPCCRVAYDPKTLEFWISIQAINAIYNSTYNLPNYVKSFESLKQTGLICDEGILEKLFTRLKMRLAKYKKRGFNPLYVDDCNFDNSILKQFVRISQNTYALTSVQAYLKNAYSLTSVKSVTKNFMNKYLNKNDLYGKNLYNKTFIETNFYPTILQL